MSVDRVMNQRGSAPWTRERAAEVAGAAQLACLLEVSAPKPGNVSPGRHFPDARYEDFLASAVAIGDPIANAGIRPVGVTVRMAIEATAKWTRSNTNLGIVLLFVPLARAALDVPTDQLSTSALPESLKKVLAGTTVDDARDVYRAIRLAGPRGLGQVAVEDVAREPTRTLLETMQLASGWDGIAREYATAFDTTFRVGVPALLEAKRDGLSWDDAIVETFLTLLVAAPDTHVARRGGADLAAQVSARARATIEAGGVRSAAGRQSIADMDRALRDRDHAASPGTTADLTAAALFVVLLGGGWHAVAGGHHAAAG